MTEVCFHSFENSCYFDIQPLNVLHESHAFCSFVSSKHSVPTELHSWQLIQPLLRLLAHGQSTYWMVGFDRHHRPSSSIGSFIVSLAFEETLVRNWMISGGQN